MSLSDNDIRRKIGIKRVEKGQITTAKTLWGWRMELSSSPEVFSNIGCVVYVTYITETLPGFTEWGRNFMSGLNYNGASFSKRKVRRSISGIRGKKSKMFWDKKTAMIQSEKKKTKTIVWHFIPSTNEILGTLRSATATSTKTPPQLSLLYRKSFAIISSCSRQVVSEYLKNEWAREISGWK